MKRATLTILALMLVLGVWGWSAAGQFEGTKKKETDPGLAGAAPAYPLKVSANGRYLVDQKGAPFLIAGDSPQALMVNLTEKDAEFFFANRARHGFNTVWINLLCRKGTGGRADGGTHDGLLPFKKADDFATPNEAYFARCDRMLRLDRKHKLLVILDPCETIDHLKPMLENGPKKCREFGRYLGNRYKDFDNLLWMHGNDFQTWKDPKHDEVVLAVARGSRIKTRATCTRSSWITW